MRLLLVCTILLAAIPSAAQNPTDDALLAGADARIERLRKADATVVVVDRSGEPMPDVHVKIEQIRHSFLFGCAAVSLLKHANVNQEDIYQKRFGNLFNFASVLTYWPDTDPEPNRQNLDTLAAQVKRLREMGIRVKGHPLILAGAAPKWAPTDADQIRELNRRRIGAMMARFKGQIEFWDVVGDATTAGNANNGLGAWARKAGPASFTADPLRWAHAANPNVVLMYNDYKLDENYDKLIRELFDLGVPLDALGLEAHMGAANWPLQRFWDTAERFNRLAKPIHWSEITVLSDDPQADHSKSWPSTPDGEQRQAEYVEKLYTLLFSHPAVHAIAWWNFVDGEWDRHPGGLLRADFCPKPAYERLVKVIKGKWWTTADLITDSDGAARFRGFTGRYRFTVTTPTATGAIESDVLQNQGNTVKLRVE